LFPWRLGMADHHAAEIMIAVGVVGVLRGERPTTNPR
jgi:hypothetical protein